MKRQFGLAPIVIAVLLCLSNTPLALAQNTPPIADAGPDQQIFVDEPTLIEGTASDPDGDPIVSWTWTIEAQPPDSEPFLSDPERPDPMFEAYTEGDYVLSLVVSDGTDDSLPDTLTISVSAPVPPVAIATASVTSGYMPLAVDFDAYQSYDPNGRTLIYDWRFGDGTTGNGIAITHVYWYPGIYEVRLRVFNEWLMPSAAYLTITVYAEEPTPEEDIEELIADVEGMNLQQGLDNSLDAKLTAALEALEALNAGQRNDAVNKLNAFINEVEAQQGKKLTSEQADYLIAEVQAIIDGIQG